MTIKVGDRLPAGSLSEFIEVETAGCTLGPNDFKIDDLTRGKKVVLFGLPGAFTPTCSAKHVPSYSANADKLKAKGVDQIVCLSVNDAFVKIALPSAIIRTLPPAFWSLPQAPITNVSFTETHQTSSTPLARSLSKFCT